MPDNAPLSAAETLLTLPPGAFPFRSRYADCDGIRVHYIDEGSGPTLVMLHGNPTWSFLYRKLVIGLRERFRCIALDLPGFGLTRAPAGFTYMPDEHCRIVGHFLDRLGIQRACLVAHDWGGPIGLAAALARPGSFARFALGNTWAWPVNGDFHFEWFSRLMGGPLGRWGARSFNVFVNGVMPAAMRRGRLPAPILDAYRAPFRHSGDVTGTHVFPWAITGAREFLSRLSMGLGELQGHPLLLIWPEDDIAFRETELGRWRELFPAASVVTLARCGHYLWEEAADECTAAISYWTDRKGAERQTATPQSY